MDERYTIAVGRCQCGCGRETGVGIRTRGKEQKGAPQAYIKGHNAKEGHRPRERRSPQDTRPRHAG